MGSHYVSLKHIYNYMVGWFFVFLLCPPYCFCPREAKTSIQAFDSLLHLIRHVLVSDQCVPETKVSHSPTRFSLETKVLHSTRFSPETKVLHSSTRFSPFWRQNFCKFHVSDHLVTKKTGLLRGFVPIICCSRRNNSPRVSDEVNHLDISKYGHYSFLGPCLNVALENPRLEIIFPHSDCLDHPQLGGCALSRPS